MSTENAMERLEALQRDLIAFSENRLPTLERLSSELEASIGDLRKLLDRKRRNDESRRAVNPTSTPNSDILKIDGVEYRVTEDFRQSALQVADELDLDELDAAQICIDVGIDTEGAPDLQLPYKALLRYHNQRLLLLDCVRLLLMQSIDLESNHELEGWLKQNVELVIKDGKGTPDSTSAYWAKCIDGLKEVEGYLVKIADHKQAAIMTGVPLEGDLADALLAQRLLLLRQHEHLGSILTYLVRGTHALPSDFRSLLSKAAGLDADTDIGIMVHYFPVLISSSAHFGASHNSDSQTSKELHSLFAVGPGQLQWKAKNFHAAATAWWLAEYSSRFSDPANTEDLRVADRQTKEEERGQLLLDSINNKAFHLMLAGCQLLKPEIWHDPAKVGLVRFLLEDHPGHASDNTFGTTPSFAELVMDDFQAFVDALVANMPDVLRRLKSDEDDRRRAWFSLPNEGAQQLELHLERFMVIMAYAYQDDSEAAQDFWADKESNLYGFLRWSSQRLPTPRVAAFCELLTSIASSEQAGNQAHRFLLEDAHMTSGKLRKTFSVCWAQIFGELELYANSIRNKPTPAQQQIGTSDQPHDESLIEPETHIMLEAYLRLATHICRTSPESRNWILREQTFHLGEVLFLLASSGQQSRVHASCFELLSALLTDKVPEVNDGMWALLDNWISGGGSAGNLPLRTQATISRTPHHERQYLQSFAANAETATALVNLLSNMITPSRHHTDITLDALPFPESLGSPYRHAGIDAYVDFVLGTSLKSTITEGALGDDQAQMDVLSCACLQFVCISLSSFNEDLVALANSTTVAVDGTIRTSSLAAYARLHPFARVMDWMFNNNTIVAMVKSAMADVEDLNSLDIGSPKVQMTLRTVTAMNLVMKLQATYFDIVRPLVRSQTPDRSSVANNAFASYDEVLLSRPDVMTKITSFATSHCTELSLESLNLLQKACASRKFSGKAQYGSGERTLLGNGLVGRLSETSDAIATDLCQYFEVYDWDLENGERPLKLIKAKAVVDVLISSLAGSSNRPTLAHCLLGFACRERSVAVMPDSAFSRGQSLFHAIAAFAAVSPYAIDNSNVSWLLSVKRGCLDIILKLAVAQMTAAIVQAELRTMDVLGASCQNQLPAFASPLWDQKSLDDKDLLLDDSATAVRDFLHVRELFFEYAALELRVAGEQRAYSIQERVLGALLGTIRLPGGQDVSSNSIFDLFDFFDLKVADPSEASCFYLRDLDLSACVRDDPETLTAFDMRMVEQLLILRKRELLQNGTVKDASEEQQIDDEMRAVLASTLSQNNWQAIEAAGMATLEAWTDLLSLVTSAEVLEKSDLANLAHQGLQVVIPRFDRSLGENMHAAALLAKLTLALVPASTVGSGSGGETASSVSERLLSTFRVCLKAITDSGTDLALRDVCYRTCGAVFSSQPLTVVNGKTVLSPNGKQLIQLVQTTGERLITVITEDAFSGRGVTRVSSLLFLDALLSLFQLGKASSSMLRALTRLNFVPVLVDQSIGSVTSSFGGSDDELITALAYFHTALSLLLRICQTADGTQLVLKSSFFAAVAESRLFSTDPDIGLDIDNPLALQQFYKLLSSVLRIITAMVIASGPNNSATLQQARAFLRNNRFSMQAVFKRTSAVQKTAGPPEKEATDVANEFSKLILVTDFLEEDEPAQLRALKVNGFT